MARRTAVKRSVAKRRMNSKTQKSKVRKSPMRKSPMRKSPMRKSMSEEMKEWRMLVMATLKELKEKDPNATMKQALQLASKRKRALKPVSAVPSSQFESVPMPKKKGLKPVSAVPSSQFETVTMPKKKGKIGKKMKADKTRRRRRTKRGGSSPEMEGSCGGP